MKLHEAIAQKDTRRRANLIKIYTKIGSWSADLAREGLNDKGEGPTMAFISNKIDVGPAHLSDLFGRSAKRRHPGINTSGAIRLVSEAKQYTIEPYLDGWIRQCAELQATPRQRIWALVPTVASWAGSHPGLAILDRTSLPAGVQNIVQTRTTSLADCAVLEIALRNVIHTIVDDASSPLQCLASVGPNLAGLTFPDTVDLDRRAAELVAAIGEFREAALNQEATYHPHLAFAMRKAAKIFTTQGQQ